MLKNKTNSYKTAYQKLLTELLYFNKCFTFTQTYLKPKQL